MMRLELGSDVRELKPNYSKGINFPQYSQIFPIEAMTGNPFHDYGVYCAILTAFKAMTRKELEAVADCTPADFRKPIAETCKRIVKEHLGYIWEPIYENY